MLGIEEIIMQALGNKVILGGTIDDTGGTFKNQ